MVAFSIHSMTALLRNMGTLQPLGVTALCSCARCRLLVPSSMWVHARMELRSGAVFPPQLLAALWIRLLGDLRDCGAKVFLQVLVTKRCFVHIEGEG